MDISCQEKKIKYFKFILLSAIVLENIDNSRFMKLYLSLYNFIYPFTKKVYTIIPFLLTSWYSWCFIIGITIILY